MQREKASHAAQKAAARAASAAASASAAAAKAAAAQRAQELSKLSMQAKLEASRLAAEKDSGGMLASAEEKARNAAAERHCRAHEVNPPASPRLSPAQTASKEKPIALHALSRELATELQVVKALCSTVADGKAARLEAAAIALALQVKQWDTDMDKVCSSDTLGVSYAKAFIENIVVLAMVVGGWQLTKSSGDCGNVLAITNITCCSFVSFFMVLWAIVLLYVEAWLHSNQPPTGPKMQGA